MADAKHIYFVNEVGACRDSAADCHEIRYVHIGNKVYWPLSDADAQSLQAAACGTGEFNGPSTANAELLEALQLAYNGLRWYQEQHPESADGSDDEANARIEAAIAKATGGNHG